VFEMGLLDFFASTRPDFEIESEETVGDCVSDCGCSTRQVSEGATRAGRESYSGFRKSIPRNSKRTSKVAMLIKRLLLRRIPANIS